MTIAPPADDRQQTPPPPDPPVPPVPAAPPAPAPSRPGARVIALVMVVVGALIVVGAVAWAAVSTVAGLALVTTERTASVTGITRLSLDVSAADLRIEFADVDEAHLEVHGPHGAGRWTLDADGADLVVRSGDDDVSGILFDRGDDAVLTLPQSLAGIDAELATAAGDVEVTGEFGRLALDVDAGDAEVDVTAETLELTLEAGDAEVTAMSVETATFTVNVGDLTADLVGAQPRSIVVDATTADAELTVPTGFYRLTGDAADADLVETDLVPSSDATSTIDARVSLSDVTISSSR